MKIGNKTPQDVWGQYVNERKKNLADDTEYKYSQCKLLGGIWTGANILKAQFVQKWELLFAIAGRQWFAQKEFSMLKTHKIAFELKLTKTVALDEIFDESRRSAGNEVSTADKAKAGGMETDDDGVGRGKIRAALWDEVFNGEYEDLIISIPNMFGNAALPAKDTGEEPSGGLASKYRMEYVRIGVKKLQEARTQSVLIRPDTPEQRAADRANAVLVKQLDLQHGIQYVPEANYKELRSAARLQWAQALGDTQKMPESDEKREEGVTKLIEHLGDDYADDVMGSRELPSAKDALFDLHKLHQLSDIIADPHFRTLFGSKYNSESARRAKAEAEAVKLDGAELFEAEHNAARKFGRTAMICLLTVKRCHHAVTVQFSSRSVHLSRPRWRQGYPRKVQTCRDNILLIKIKNSHTSLPRRRAPRGPPGNHRDRRFHLRPRCW